MTMIKNIGKQNQAKIKSQMKIKRWGYGTMEAQGKALSHTGLAQKRKAERKINGSSNLAMFVQPKCLPVFGWAKNKMAK